MPLLPKVEAAIEKGVTVELIDYFISKCPKPNGSRKLQAKNLDGESLIDVLELDAFWKYLSEPWPKPAKGGRPNIPDPIKKDVREESHHSCAICGLMDSGEIAHIRPLSESYNNSPDNLILLCPNHHSKYDFGFRPASNVTEEEINAAKTLKRNSRRRCMLLEKNTTRLLMSVVRLFQEIEEKLREGPTAVLCQTYITETKHLLGEMPKLIESARDAAKEDQNIPEPERLLAEKAPSLSKMLVGAENASKETEVRSAVQRFVSATREALVDIDEVDCPHCHGRGTTGLVGDLCRYCKGSCFVSQKKADEYKEEAIDEVDCPHCSGRGQTGLSGDLCRYCRGSCRISKKKSEEYDEQAIDEVDCPHCKGLGQTGLSGDLCRYCRGSCRISKKKLEEYDEQAIDEVDCPHCKGLGQTGLSGDLCRYCRGSCRISKKRAEEYAEDDMDEVECPRCNGKGTTGLVGDLCALCKGKQVVSDASAAAYRKKFGR